MNKKVKDQRSMSILKIFLLIISINAIGQDKIEWSPNQIIKIEDFQSNATKIGGKEIEQFVFQPAIRMDFSFQMSSYEFMLTKNFNSKVSTTFSRKASVIVASDTALAESLVAYAQLNFNLLELYARKYRKRLYESKGILSEVSFFQKAYEGIDEEFNERQTVLSQLTNLGQNEERLKEANNQVLKEISELSEFCKICKPRKK